MSLPTERKWFVYVKDHPEGPYTVLEIQDKIAQGLVVGEPFAWAEGMDNWQAVKSLADFAPSVENSAPIHFPPMPQMGDGGSHEAGHETGHETEPEHAPSNAPEFSQGPEFSNTPAFSHAPEFPQETEFSREPEPPPEPLTQQHPQHPQQYEQLHQSEAPIPDGRTHPGLQISIHEEKTDDLEVHDIHKVHKTSVKSAHKGQMPFGIRVIYRSLVFCAFCVAVVMTHRAGYFDPILEIPAVASRMDVLSNWIRPKLIVASQKMPLLTRWISPIPGFSDVSKEEYLVLKDAAGAKLISEGPRFAVAVSTADPVAPSFYVATNMPDRTKVDLYLIGVPASLLNQISFAKKVELTILNKMAKTSPVLTDDAKSIPRGDYMIYLVAGQNQDPAILSALKKAPGGSVSLPVELPKDSQVLLFRNVFLGGPKDANYETKLKEFHEKIKARAIGELNESKQFMLTLASQLESSKTEFAHLRQGKMTAQKRKSWEFFHTEWTRLQTELDQIFQKWTPEALRSEYFYGSVYEEVQKAGQYVFKMHGIQHSYFVGGAAGSFEGKQNKRLFEKELQEAAAVATDAVEKLRVKIGQLEKNPEPAQPAPAQVMHERTPK